MKILLSAVFLVVYLSFDSASALRCYYCSAFIGYKNDCEAKVNNKTIQSTNCTTGYTACMILVANNTITRNCAASNACQLASNQTGFKSCSTCVTDLCNDGLTLAPSVILPLGLVTFLFISRSMITAH